MRNYPTLEPVVVDRGTYYIDRVLDRAGRVEVGVGDRVSPTDVIARTGDIEKSFTLYLANELGVPNDSLKKYLAKSIGSSINEGEPIARVRRGLRTAAVRSPATGTLVHVDDSEGTVTLTASTGPKELTALVSGVVEQVHSDRGVTIRAEGARVYGIVGFGREASGKLIVGCDRHDRELTADQVSKDWRGAVVLAGMTVGVPALNKLRENGVAGVIVGSISEGDIRRFLDTGSGSNPASFWTQSEYGMPATDGGPVVIVTEGFGRLPMANPVFEFLKGHAGASVSVSARTTIGEHLARPEIYIPGEASDEGSITGSADIGRQVRVTDSKRLGTTGNVRSGGMSHTFGNGLQRDFIEVEFESGDIEFVAAENVEVLV